MPKNAVWAVPRPLRGTAWIFAAAGRGRWKLASDKWDGIPAWSPDRRFARWAGQPNRSRKATPAPPMVEADSEAQQSKRRSRPSATERPKLPLSRPGRQVRQVLGSLAPARCRWTAPTPGCHRLHRGGIHRAVPGQNGNLRFVGRGGGRGRRRRQQPVRRGNRNATPENSGDPDSIPPSTAASGWIFEPISRLPAARFRPSCVRGVDPEERPGICRQGLPEVSSGQLTRQGKLTASSIPEATRDRQHPSRSKRATISSTRTSELMRRP